MGDGGTKGLLGYMGASAFLCVRWLSMEPTILLVPGLAQRIPFTPWLCGCRLDEGLRATTLQTVGPAVPRVASGRRADGGATRPPSGMASRAPSVAPARTNARAPSVGGSSIPGAAARAVAGLGPGSVAGSGVARSQASGVSAGGASAKSRASAVSAGVMAARDKLAQLAASLSPEKRQELEAERARLVQLLLDPTSAAAAAAEVSAMVQAARDVAAAAASTAQAPLAAAPSALALGAQPSAATVATAVTAAGSKAGFGRRMPLPPKLPNLVAAHYVLDFGFATKGVNKIRKVKITNTSMQQVRSRRPLIIGTQTLGLGALLETLPHGHAGCCCASHGPAAPSTGCHTCVPSSCRSNSPWTSHC